MRVMLWEGSGRYSPGPGMVKLLEKWFYQELQRFSEEPKHLQDKDLNVHYSKGPPIPFVQCEARNGPAFPGGDWICTFVVAEMRTSGCGVLLS